MTMNQIVVRKETPSPKRVHLSSYKTFIESSSKSIPLKNKHHKKKEKRFQGKTENCPDCGMSSPAGKQKQDV